jgi:stage II sporulation protein D
VPLEEYVLGSALSEVSPVGENPATVARVFELQAIIARTYAIGHLGRHRDEGFDLCDRTHCQIYEPGRIRTSRFADAARAAVGRTAGVALVFSGRPAEALYHADCGGHTASADIVWGGTPVAYLTGSKDDVPPRVHRTWTFSTPATRLRAALNADARTSVGTRLDALVVAGRDASGRAAKIELGGERTRTVKGEDLRAILNDTFGDRAILSTRFSVSRRAGVYEFSGTGFGHGVGLCQVGAIARLSRGEATAVVLATYYPGTSLADLGPRRFLARANPVGGRGTELLESP